eukprot:TRINITY_DN952_c0_g2_i2.p1 TRINITY_DN952_c0_g2~~TRINITY_DN952_c0_g2_i2.p1  ORF type:complete len:675 (-),score=115.81 TRINITY_DN952_c0_g2_i2:153-2177(-)
MSLSHRARSGDTIWRSVYLADEEAVFRLLAENKNLLRERGPVGDTPFHSCFLYNTPKHQELARKLVAYDNSIVNDVYEGELYGGENALHISVVNQDIEMVKFLIRSSPDKHALMSCQTTGTFFQEGNRCYFGEYPLFFAASTGQLDIVEFLVKEGADVFAIDSNGNTILHLLVTHNRMNIYGAIEKILIRESNKLKKKSRVSKGHASKKSSRNKRISDRTSTRDEALSEKPQHDYFSLRKVLNNRGHSPLTLSAALGHVDMFSSLLVRMKETQWKFGPVSCNLYPLDELDTPFQGTELENENFRSAIQVIVYEQQVALLSNKHVASLMEKKWQRFAKSIFFTRLGFTLFYLLCLIISIFLRSNLSDEDRDHESFFEYPENTFFGKYLSALSIYRIQEYSSHIILYLCDLVVIFLAGFKLSSELREISNIGHKKYFSGSGALLLENVLSLLHTLLIYVVFGIKLVLSGMKVGSSSRELLDRVELLEDCFLAIAVLVGWSYLFFFLLGFKLTGPLVIMVLRMLTTDVVRFLAVYIVFLGSFSQAFFILYNEHGFFEFLNRVKLTFMVMLGDIELDSYIELPGSFLATPLIVFYVLVVTIMLLNILVAMMGSTFNAIYEDADKEWQVQWAKIIFSIENEMTDEERCQENCKYWCDIDGKRYLQVEDYDPSYYGLEEI